MENKDECYPATAKDFDEAVPKGALEQVDIIVGSKGKLNNLQKLWKWFFKSESKIYCENIKNSSINIKINN